MFARTLRDELVLLPTARLEVDGTSVMASDMYASGQTTSLGLARLDAAGWVQSKVYFDFSADFSSGFSLRHTDNYVAVAPWNDLVILQAGQFDVPFTLENRTPDRYLDFPARGAAVRAFAIPENKDQGVMVHGTTGGRNYGYAAGVFNGEGPGVTGVDSHVDFAGRGWLAPFSFRDPDALREVTVGASAWTGDHSTGPIVGQQTTQGGYAAFDPSLWWMDGATPAPQLREHGRLNAIGLDLNAPFKSRFGLRFEWIAKTEALAAVTTDDPARRLVGSTMTLSGWASYLEIWCWVLGDDRILGAPAAPGLGLPPRLADFDNHRPRHGLMLAARVDYIDESLTASSSAAASGVGVASLGSTQLTSLTVGGSYWFSRRARFVANYVFNHLGGATPYLEGLDGKNEQELVARLALAL